MNTIFMNSKNSKMGLQNGVKHVPLSDLSIYYTWKNIRKQHGMKNLNYLMEFILYHVYSTVFNTPSRGMKQLLINYQSNYVSTKFRIELHSRLKPGA